MDTRSTPEVLTDLLRDFMRKLREHLALRADDEASVVIERIFGFIALAGAAVLLALPGSPSREGLIAALFGAALRWLTAQPGKELA